MSLCVTDLLRRPRTVDRPRRPQPDGASDLRQAVCRAGSRSVGSQETGPRSPPWSRVSDRTRSFRPRGAGHPFERPRHPRAMDGSTTTMIGTDTISRVIGQDVYDESGEKIGSAAEVYLDDETGQPEWVTVRTGLFGTKESFVPIRDANLTDDGVRVPVSKERVKDAPKIDTDGHLSPQEEQELYRYYGMGTGTDTAMTTKTTTGMATGTTTGMATDTTSDFDARD